ncbi:lambda-exonuclease family protein [Alkalilimnicola sp. S0819]|uniref:lambda-exonuclease family protein n=1 Tax=Alkalilimnicola sp. S0819 TaxID=2613922 RepID=UPI0012620117|nr:YqaJ viral recombinase family protein [Alkalilimnicola sp. S0819]KAB7628170.1 hypothetical protein F3N43_00200 [Alkalilimnicola sp. S0819]MPQ15057.1 hypothetical protein [Alkalilimnicola sp. S0819]
MSRPRAVIPFPAQVQGSAEWHAHRAGRGNASELPALLGCSPWFPRTPLELWELKTGRRRVTVSPAMRRGLRLEPRARAWLEALSDTVYEPQLRVRGRLSASLDGLRFDERELVEIKCPVHGAASATWAQVAGEGRPPEHYWWQVQQQLYCAGAERARFAVFHAEGGRIVDMVECPVLADEQAQARLEQAWADFFPWLDADEPPPPLEGDARRRDDRAWRDAVSRWKEARHWLDQARQAEQEARRALLGQAGDRSTVGAGLRVTRHWQKGALDWGRLAQELDPSMDLEPFRKPGSWRYRISEQD